MGKPKCRIAVVSGVKIQDRYMNFTDEQGVRVTIMSVEEAQKMGDDLKIE